MDKKVCGKKSSSFITVGICQLESVNVARLYLQLGQWDSVRDKVNAENLLQYRTLSSAHRICQEIINRLKHLTDAELTYLINAAPPEQGYFLWIALCRRYEFIAIFAQEVLRESFLSLRRKVVVEDFDAFFNRYSEWNDWIDAIKPTTRQKLRQVLFKIMREADLISETGEIKCALLSPGFIANLNKQNALSIQVLPTLESDLKGIMEWDTEWLASLSKRDSNISSM